MTFSKSNLARARKNLSKMRRRVVLIAEGKSTRIGLEKVRAQNIPSAEKHIVNVEDEELKGKLTEEFDWLKKKLLETDPATLPETKTDSSPNL